MKISVIIPTLNEEKQLPLLLEDLHNQAVLADEIIIVDAGSQDKTVDNLKKFTDVKLIKSQPPVGSQRNLGIKKAKGEMIILLDADVRLDQAFIQKVVTQFDQQNLDIACPRYIPNPGSLFISPVYLFFNLMFWLFQLVFPSGAGSCIIFRKSLWRVSGMINPEYTYDDIEFIRRASKCGKFRILPLSVLVSDRRFRKEGVLQASLKYLILSIPFTLGWFGMANKINYKFGDYE